MTIHYHGTPISPLTALEQCAGRFFCVSHAHPDQVKRCHDLGQGVMLDNGAFSAWQRGHKTDWNKYYDWCEQWLSPTTWAVVPDVIDGSQYEQEKLCDEWPFRRSWAAPVWHLHEPIERLEWLVGQWPRVCFGSSGEYSIVGSEAWHRRVTAAWDRIHGRRPNIHMLRGMQCVRMGYPFASVDSTDLARNHNRPQNTPLDMVTRWDAIQCPIRWTPQAQHEQLFETA